MKLINKKEDSHLGIVYVAQDVKEAVSDFNFFCKYRKIKTNLSEDVNIRIFNIMGKYNLEPKNMDDEWTVEEISLAIFGDFEK